MTRLRLVLGAFLLTSALAGCGSDSDSPETSGDNGAAEPSGSDPFDSAGDGALKDLELGEVTSTNFCAKLDSAALEALLSKPKKPLVYAAQSRTCAAGGGTGLEDATVASIGFVPGKDVAKVEAGYRKDTGGGLGSIGKITEVPGLADGAGFMGDAFLGTAIFVGVKDGYVQCLLSGYGTGTSKAELAAICIDQVRRLGS